MKRAGIQETNPGKRPERLKAEAPARGGSRHRARGLSRLKVVCSLATTLVAAGLLSTYGPQLPGLSRTSPTQSAEFAQVTPRPVFPLQRLEPEPSPEEIRRREIAEGLRALLELEAAAIDGHVSAHVRLENGIEAGLHADEPVAAASVIKLPVMGVLYDAWEKGELERNPRDERLMRRMITVSHNGATNALIDRLGMARINRWLTENGYTETVVHARILDKEPLGPNLVTASEMTRMLEQIVQGTLVSPAASSEMRGILLDQRWQTRIPADLPSEAVVGNKTGTMSDLLHDVAFVETPGGLRYTIAVLIERDNRPAVTSEAIAQLSRQVYDYLQETVWVDEAVTGFEG